MCGRYTLTPNPDEIVATFGDDLAPVDIYDLGWQPRFNIAPTQNGLVAHSGANQRNVLREMRWGLIPSWSKDHKIGSKLINARSETVAEKPSFRAAFRRRRCLVFASGYYEWSSMSGSKHPYFIQSDENPILSFGGLWETWHSPQGDEISTYSILTTNANENLNPLHHRMPVCINRGDFSRWLSPKTEMPLVNELLRAPAGGTFGYNVVSNYVNSPRNEGPDCIRAPIAGHP